MADELDLERVICPLHELADPGAKGFTLGSGDWPLRGFVVRRGATVRAYVNHCPHAGFPLNWQPDAFLAAQVPLILCVMHGALFDIGTGRMRVGPVRGPRAARTAAAYRRGLRDARRARAARGAGGSWPLSQWGR